MSRRRDPLLAAGRVWCEICQCFALPIDAAYVTPTELGGLILVEYEGCEHVAEVCIVDVASIPVDSRCDAFTRSGRRCRNPALGSGRCWHHSKSQAALP